MKPHLSDDGDIFHMEGLASVLPECDTRPAVDLIIWLMITLLPCLYVQPLLIREITLILLMITIMVRAIQHLVESLLSTNSNVFGFPLLN